MRIISGSYRGKKIHEPKDVKTRPLKDLTKESIFNIINHSNKFDIDLKNSKILDLFSGVGSFGIECLSRGVKTVVFIESYSGVLPILKKNLINLNTVKNYEIIEKNIYDDKTFLSLKNKFDIIFLDPPYKNNIAESSILKLSKFGWIDENTLIILEKGKDECFRSSFQLIDRRIYGNTEILFLKF